VLPASYTCNFAVGGSLYQLPLMLMNDGGMLYSNILEKFIRVGIML